jgi:hypothetical protein
MGDMSRGIMGRTIGVAPIMVGMLALCVPAHAEPATVCGRSGDVAGLLLSLQTPAVEGLWRDKLMFVMRDNADGSLWAFSLKNSTVHPAVRCRRPVAPRDGVTHEAGQICGASEKACASFAAQADARFQTPTGAGAVR